MARKAAAKTARKSASKGAKGARTRATNVIEEGTLTKGQMRKLNALRKSVGEDIGNKAFADWLAKQSVETREPVDKNALQIADALKVLIDAKKLAIPRGGYLVTRGRGRVVVTRARSG